MKAIIRMVPSHFKHRSGSHYKYYKCIALDRWHRLKDEIFSSYGDRSVSALLMQGNSTFRVWLEAIKAVIMATAVQNIEGAARLRDGDGDRDRDGGVQAARADDVARGVNGN